MSDEPIVYMTDADVEPWTERIVVDGVQLATLRATGPITPEALGAAMIAGLRRGIETSQPGTASEGFPLLVELALKQMLRIEKDPERRAGWSALYQGVKDLLTASHAKIVDLSSIVSFPRNPIK